MLPKHRRPTHPGEILTEEFLIPMELSQARLAEHLGWTPAKVNEIVNEKRGITHETALAFSDAFGTTPNFWINLQNAYDLWEAQQRHKTVEKLA